MMPAVAAGTVGTGILAAIPYTTFPTIDLGPLELRTFGLMVGLGVVVGVGIAARMGERVGVSADDTVSLGTRMVIAGVVGARITWVLTHLGQVDSPVDVIAVWEGGLQFSGGFIAAVVVGLPRIRQWARALRWQMIDRMAFGLTAGLAIGRIGCYAVGEHLGGPTTFFLATRYDGGSTREGPLVVGQAIHNTALYEFLSVLVLAVVLWWLLARRRAGGATVVGVFLVWYGAGRFATDFLRAYDDTVLGLTGAQWLSLGLLVASVWVWRWVRPSLRDPGAPAAGGAAGGADVPDADVPDADAPGPATPAAS